jgi:dolichol kinase
MLVAGILGAMFFVWVVLPQEFNLPRIITLGAIATLMEGISPKEIDNFLIPIAVIGSTYAI